MLIDNNKSVSTHIFHFWEHFGTRFVMVDMCLVWDISQFLVNYHSSLYVSVAVSFVVLCATWAVSEVCGTSDDDVEKEFNTSVTFTWRSYLMYLLFPIKINSLTSGWRVEVHRLWIRSIVSPSHLLRRDYMFICVSHPLMTLFLHHGRFSVACTAQPAPLSSCSNSMCRCFWNWSWRCPCHCCNCYYCVDVDVSTPCYPKSHLTSMKS